MPAAAGQTIVNFSLTMKNAIFGYCLRDSLLLFLKGSAKGNPSEFVNV